MILITSISNACNLDADCFDGSDEYPINKACNYNQLDEEEKNRIDNLITPNDIFINSYINKKECIKRILKILRNIKNKMCNQKETQENALMSMIDMVDNSEKIKELISLIFCGSILKNIKLRQKLLLLINVIISGKINQHKICNMIDEIIEDIEDLEDLETKWWVYILAIFIILIVIFLIYFFMMRERY